MDDFSGFFHAIAAAKQHIRLMNVFKGVPIAYEADVVEVSPDSILVRTDRFQIVCLYSERETYLESPNLPNILSARVRSLRVPLSIAELVGFEPVSHSLSDRRNVRVQPAEPLNGEVLPEGANEPFEAELADISQDGMAIFIPRGRYYPPSYHRGAPLTITLQIPGEYESVQPKSSLEEPASSDPMARFDRDLLRLAPLPSPSSTGSETDRRRKIPFGEMEIHGAIANTREEQSGGRYRIGLRILPNDPSRRLIFQFIAQRQAEIIREVRELYQLISMSQE